MVISTLRKVNSVILKELREEWNDYRLGAKFINYGNCYNWAAAVQILIPDVKLCSDPYNGGHAFVLIDGKYYDSETLGGVKNWQKLKLYSIGNKYRIFRMEIQSKNKFYKEWDIRKSYINKLCNEIKRLK